VRNQLFIAVLLAAGGSGGDDEGRARAAAAGCPVADVEANKALARRWHEAVNERNIDSLDAVLAADIIHDGATFPEAFGAAGVKRILSAALAGFPDIRFTQEDLIAEADRVAVRYRAEGTHLGEFQGIAPTGRRVAWTGINMFRIDCGRIVQSWSEVDGVGRLQQLGVIDE
jgi:steroid delta-isomerase-like uncharacterized protein